MKKFLKSTLICLAMVTMIACSMLAFVACDKKVPTNVAPQYETDLSVNLESDIGLYFFGANIDDHKRYSDDISTEYFDRSKPTMVYFHGWATMEMGHDELLTGMSTCSALLKEDDAINAPDLDYVELFKQQGYNVCAMDYSSYAMNLLILFEYVWVDFEGDHSIACTFAKEYVNCFENYDGEVRFWGHSFGAQSALATAYLLSKMRDHGLTNAPLPSRISIADPYIGDLVIQFNQDIVNQTIDNVNEQINGRMPVELVADAVENLHNKGVVVDFYCAMPMAYDAFFDIDLEHKVRVQQKLYANSVWTVLVGCQQKFGKVGDIHVIAEDWMFHSFFAPVKCVDGVYYPTASLSNEEMAMLVGHTYKSTYVGFDVERDVLVETTVS